mmetsp:Transcript_34604/g.83515  ORF Transcript_34604/g.83515 Transcript_34604/m.83515 type:complete len:267 (+) Transcript_34604:372-1172(+)
MCEPRNPGQSLLAKKYHRISPPSIPILRRCSFQPETFFPIQRNHDHPRQSSCTDHKLRRCPHKPWKIQASRQRNGPRCISRPESESQSRSGSCNHPNHWCDTHILNTPRTSGWSPAHWGNLNGVRSCTRPSVSACPHRTCWSMRTTRPNPTSPAPCARSSLRPSRSHLGAAEPRCAWHRLYNWGASHIPCGTPDGDTPEAFCNSSCRLDRDRQSGIPYHCCSPRNNPWCIWAHRNVYCTWAFRSPESSYPGMGLLGKTWHSSVLHN